MSTLLGANYLVGGVAEVLLTSLGCTLNKNPILVLLKGSGSILITVFLLRDVVFWRPSKYLV